VDWDDFDLEDASTKIQVMKCSKKTCSVPANTGRKLPLTNKEEIL
jgi:hypothetical protein